MIVRLLAAGAVVLVMAGSAAMADPIDDAAAAAYRGDYGTAVKIWKQLADGGMAVAQNNLGSAYSKGLGIKKDPVEADKWYLAAALQGLPEAQSNLGFQYEQGLGVPKDYDQALKWYRLAAAQGSIEAEFSLGLMYGSGTGVTKDYPTAFMWLALSSAKGETEARKALAALIQMMTPEQIVAGQKLQLDAQRAPKQTQ